MPSKARTLDPVSVREHRPAPKDWKDLAGRFAHASPAIKEALRLMREARYAD